MNAATVPECFKGDPKSEFLAQSENSQDGLNPSGNIFSFGSFVISLINFFRRKWKYYALKFFPKSEKWTPICCQVDWFSIRLYIL